MLMHRHVITDLIHNPDVGGRHTGFKAVSTGQGYNKTIQRQPNPLSLDGIGLRPVPVLTRDQRVKTMPQHSPVILDLIQYPQGGASTHFDTA